MSQATKTSKSRRFDAEYIKHICRRKWKSGNFIHRSGVIPVLPTFETNALIPYEEYMSALPCVEDWQPGPVFVFFPPEGTEDNELHTHPISDRIITVIDGSGEFIAVRNRKVCRYPLTRGTRVYMPRGVLHTFLASSEGLVVESIHNPYVPIGHPLTIKAPRHGKYHI